MSAETVKTVRTLDEIRLEAKTLAQLTQDAVTAIEVAGTVAERLYRDLCPGDVELVRFEYEVVEFAKALARDLGAEVDDLRGNFDLDAAAVDARDLLDLIEAAAARPEQEQS